MSEYELKICTNEDIGLIEDHKERIEAMQHYINNIEQIQELLKKNNIEYDKIDFYRFNITVSEKTLEDIENQLDNKLSELYYFDIEDY